MIFNTHYDTLKLPVHARLSKLSNDEPVQFRDG